MTPEELAQFAGDIRRFSPRDIDHLHRVLFRLQQDGIEFTPAHLRREYEIICLEDGHRASADDACLAWLLNLFATDPDVPLNEKFLDVLQEANIVLTTDGTTTDGGTEYEGSVRGGAVGHPLPFSRRPQSPDSIASVDENDAHWQQAVALDNRKLASQALEQWQLKLHLKREAYLDHEDPAMNQFADGVYLRNLAKKTISHWNNTVKELQEIERLANDYRAQRDASCALRQWTLAARGRLFTRVQDERLVRKMLGSWRDKTAEIKEMEGAADDFCSHKAVESTLARMVATKVQIVQAETQAVFVYEDNLVRRVLNRWLARLDGVRLDERRADAAADYFAGKHALQRWRDRTRTMRDEKTATEARRHVLAFKYLLKWRACVRRSKNARYAEAYKTMRRKVKVNIARAVIHTWQEKATRVREMNAVADDFRSRRDAADARRVAHGAVVSMFGQTQRVQEAHRQADVFFRQHLVERLHIFGSSWLVPTRQILANRKRADDYRATRTASYAVAVLRSWRNVAFRAQRLEEDADVLFQRNEKKRALGFLQKWRRAVPPGHEVEAGREEGREERLIPVTPAARRSQLLLASTTPAYTPATGLFGGGRVVEDVEEEAES